MTDIEQYESEMFLSQKPICLILCNFLQPLFTTARNKLECFSSKYIQPSVLPGAYPRVENLGYASTLLTNFRIGWKGWL